MNFKFNNPDRDLRPLGSSNAVFWNRKPVAIKAKFRKNYPEGADFFYLMGDPIFECGGMIYWFFWRGKQFDVRDMRAKGKFKKQEYKSDFNYHNPFARLKTIAFQLEKIAQKQDIEAFMSGLLWKY